MIGQSPRIVKPISFSAKRCGFSDMRASRTGLSFALACVHIVAKTVSVWYLCKRMPFIIALEPLCGLTTACAITPGPGIRSLIRSDQERCFSYFCDFLRREFAPAGYAADRLGLSAFALGNHTPMDPLVDMLLIGIFAVDKGTVLDGDRRQNCPVVREIVVE